VNTDDLSSVQVMIKINVKLNKLYITKKTKLKSKYKSNENFSTSGSRTANLQRSGEH